VHAEYPGVRAIAKKLRDEGLDVSYGAVYRAIKRGKNREAQSLPWLPYVVACGFHSLFVTSFQSSGQPK